MWMIILAITVCSLTNSYWIVCALQTNNNYTFFFEHHNLHISVFIYSCSWYEFHMEALKHILISNEQVHNFNEWAYLYEYNTHIKKKNLDSGIRTWKRDLRISTSPLLRRLVYQGTWATNQSIAFTSVLLSEDLEKSSTLIPDFLQIRQTCWCLCLTDIRHKSL
jgi:hypothetical protein